jgi:hypothetical protein
MNHEVVEISSVHIDSPDVVLVIECTCGEIYRFTKEFHPEWNLWTKSYYTDAVAEAYCVLCPKEDPMEKRAVVLTEKEKKAHTKAASKAQQRRIEQAAKQRAKEQQKKKEDNNAKR